MSGRTWSVKETVAENGVRSLIVESDHADIMSWHITNWPDEASIEVAHDLAKALNALERLREEIYGLPPPPEQTGG